jgi:UDP-GlcNAc:undecaprenyl-phosphate GlcNAc-1-phosphate transferase
VNPWADVPSAIRYPLSFAIPLLATLLLTPRAAALARRLGVLDRPGGHKTHVAATPYLGGVAVAAGLAGIGVLAGGAAGELTTILGCGAILALLGFLDDVRGVSAIVRFSFEAACGLFLWQAGIRAGVFDAEWADLALTCVWVVAVTNAVNFIDNMDGVAAGVAAASAFGIFAVAAHNDDVLVASLALAVAGSCLGFLRFNVPPATIFLGDAGSLLLGLLLASLILKLDLPVGEAAPRILVTALLAAVPLFDLGLVTIARLSGRRPIWRGGSDHSTHRLRARGRSDAFVALALIGAQALCCLVALVVSANASSDAVVWIAAGAASVAVLVLLVAFLRLPAEVRS